MVALFYCTELGLCGELCVEIVRWKAGIGLNLRWSFGIEVSLKWEVGIGLTKPNKLCQS